MTYVFVRVQIKAWNKSISIRTDQNKRLAACVLRVILVGFINAHQFDARGRQGRKPNSEPFFFFATKTTKASTVAGNGEKCVPCDPGYELRKGGSLTKSCAENTRGWDRKKKTQAARTNVFPALLGACIDRLGAVPSNNNNQVRTWTYKKCLFWPKKRITTPVHYE